MFLGEQEKLRMAQKPDVKYMGSHDKGVYIINSDGTMWKYTKDPVKRCGVWRKIKLPQDYDQYGTANTLPEVT